MIQISLDTSVLIGLIDSEDIEIIELVRSSQGELNFNDALISISCRNRAIPFIASFDRDFDQLAWLRRIAQPDDLG